MPAPTAPHKPVIGRVGKTKVDQPSPKHKAAFDFPDAPPEVQDSGGVEPVSQQVELALIDVEVESRHVDQDRVKTLAANIAEHGLLQPIVVFTKADGRYSLGPGRHRFEAHKLLKRKTIAAMVWPAAGNDMVRLAQAIENLQRKDLTVIEEAINCAIIVEAEGGDVAKSAALLGVTVKWLNSRLALNRLSPRVQQLLVEGKIYLGHALYLARLVDHAKQEEIAGRVSGGKRPFGGKNEYPPEPVHECRHMVEAELRSLAGVPWKLDMEFAGKPSCASCMHNSANQPTLFEGERIAADKAFCLHAPCYSEKTKAASSAVIKASNELVKMTVEGGVSATPKQAEKAIEAREVEFVKPAAVAERAKRIAQPTKATAAERQGKSRSNDDWQARNKYDTAHREWHSKLSKQLAAKLRTDPVYIGLTVLFLKTDVCRRADDSGGKLPSALASELDKLLNCFKKLDSTSLVTMASAIKPGRYSAKEYFPLDDWEMPDLVTKRLCEELKIDVPAEPKLEDFVKSTKKGGKAK